MREIKFRAWDKKTKVMWTCNNPLFGKEVGWWKCKIPENDKKVQVRIQNNPPKISEDFEIMQFTSLLDRNGKEIYEGDILQAQSYDSKIFRIGEVFYSDNLAQYLCKEWFDYPRHFGSHRFEELKEYEVIGNVYETPELLTTHPIPALTEEEIKKDSYILVPKEIEFVYDNGNLALRFNNGKQMLLASTTDKSIFVVYDTTYYYSYPLISCKLIPCKREDLKPGDWAFGAYRDNEDFKTLYNYSLILDEKSYALVNNGANIIIGDVDCVYWYKVERV